MSGRRRAKSPVKPITIIGDDTFEPFVAATGKLHFPHGYRTLVAEGGKDGLPSAYKNEQTPLALFNLKDDIEIEKCRGVSSGCGFTFTGTCR